MAFSSPFDLLTVPSNEQDIIRCLVRRPQLTIPEIAKFTKIPLDELEQLLNGMVQEARLLRDQKNRFEVSYASPKSPLDSGRPSLLNSLFGH